MLSFPVHDPVVPPSCSRRSWRAPSVFSAPVRNVERFLTAPPQQQYHAMRTSAAFRHAAVIAVMTDEVAKQDDTTELGLIWFVSDGLLCQQRLLIKEHTLFVAFPVC